jgi:hypothetical protein
MGVARTGIWHGTGGNHEPYQGLVMSIPPTLTPDPLSLAVDALITAVNDLISPEDSTVFGLALSRLIEETLSRSSSQAAGASVLFHRILDTRITEVATRVDDHEARLKAIEHGGIANAAP